MLDDSYSLHASNGDTDSGGENGLFSMRLDDFFLSTYLSVSSSPLHIWGLLLLFMGKTAAFRAYLFVLTCKSLFWRERLLAVM